MKKLKNNIQIQNNYLKRTRPTKLTQKHNKPNKTKISYQETKNQKTILITTTVQYKRKSKPQTQSINHKQKPFYKKLPPQPPLILSNNTQIHNLNQITHTTNTHPDTHKVKTVHAKNKSIKPNSIPNKHKHTQIHKTINTKRPLTYQIKPTKNFKNKHKKHNKTTRIIKNIQRAWITHPDQNQEKHKHHKNKNLKMRDTHHTNNINITNNTYSKLGGHNHTQTNLKDIYYTKTPDNTVYIARQPNSQQIIQTNHLKQARPTGLAHKPIKTQKPLNINLHLITKTNKKLTTQQRVSNKQKNAPKPTKQQKINTTPYSKHTYTKQNTQNKTNNPTLNNNKPKQKQTPTKQTQIIKTQTSLNPYVQKTNHTKHLKRTRPTGLVPNQIKINNKNIKTKHNNKTHTTTHQTPKPHNIPGPQNT